LRAVEMRRTRVSLVFVLRYRVRIAPSLHITLRFVLSQQAGGGAAAAAALAFFLVVALFFCLDEDAPPYHFPTRAVSLQQMQLEMGQTHVDHLSSGRIVS
jgi:hypothetical protein